MRRSILCVCCVFAVSVAATRLSQAADYGLREGTPEIKSAGALAFGPDGILFIGDSTSATVFAIDTQDTAGSSKSKLNVEKIDQKIASMLGTEAEDILINDLAVNPLSGAAYLSVSRGRGPDAIPVLMRVDPSGKPNEVDTTGVKFAAAELPNPPAPGGTGRRNNRAQAITDLLYVDGRLFVAGLSNEEFASKLRSIPFPFQATDAGTSVEIYHGAHGRWETRSPVRTFASYKINNEPHLLAAYTCTPLVKFPVAELKPGTKLVGHTIAELGNRNRPIDMVVYSKGGKDYILMANSSRGMMKITTENIDGIEAIESRVGGEGTAGLPYDTIADMQGVVQMDRLNEDNALVLVQTEEGTHDLKTVALP